MFSLNKKSRFDLDAFTNGAVRFVLGWLFAICAIGLPLAGVGAFKAVLVLPAALLVGLAFAICATTVRFNLPGTKMLVAALLICAAASGFVGAAPSNHFATNRDAGVYSLTGRWLSKDGSLLVPSHEGAFDTAKVDSHGFAFYDTRADHKLYPQFSHGLPTVLAVSNWIGGVRLATRTNAVIIGFALFGFFLLARRFMRDGFALSATFLVGFSLPFVWFARDTYSEPLAFAFIIYSAVLLCELVTKDDSCWCEWAAAGALAGASLMVRIDGLVIIASYLIALASIFVLKELDLKKIGWSVVAMTVPAVIGIVDLITRSGRYWHDEKSEVHSASILIGFSIILLLVIAVFGNRFRKLATNTSYRTNPLAISYASLYLLAGIFVAFIRPHIEKTTGAPNSYIGSLQHAAGLPIEAGRKYSESTVPWLSYYLGWVAIAIGIIGVALLVWKWVREIDVKLVSIFVLVIPGLLYLYKPGIAPDQIWAARRFVPNAIPLTIMIDFAVLSWLFDLKAHKIFRVASVVIAVAIGAQVLYPTTRIPKAREINYPLAQVDSICGTLGKNSAALVVPNGGIEDQLPQAIRIECGVPVAALPVGYKPALLDQLSNQWKRRNIQMKLVGDWQTQVPKGWRISGVSTSRAPQLERVVQRAPSKEEFVNVKIQIYSLSE